MVENTTHMQQSKHIGDDSSSSSEDDDDDDGAGIGVPVGRNMMRSTVVGDPVPSAAALQPSTHVVATHPQPPMPARQQGNNSRIGDTPAAALSSSEVLGVGSGAGATIAGLPINNMIYHNGEPGIFVPLSAAASSMGDPFVSLALANTLRQQYGSTAAGTRTAMMNCASSIPPAGMSTAHHHQPLFLGGAGASGATGTGRALSSEETTGAGDTNRFHTGFDQSTGAPQLSNSTNRMMPLSSATSSGGGGGGTSAVTRGRGGGGDELLLNMLRGRGNVGPSASSSMSSAWGLLTGGSQIGIGGAPTPYLPLSSNTTGGGNPRPASLYDQHSEPPGEAFLLARALLQEVAATGTGTGTNAATTPSSATSWPQANALLSQHTGQAAIANQMLSASNMGILPPSSAHQQTATGRAASSLSSSHRSSTEAKSTPPPSSSIILGTGKNPKLMHTRSDDESLSPYQCLVRRQIEIFEATEADIHTTAQGRNRPIVMGQIGIRCIHCGRLPVEKRARGAVYFPSTLLSTYQTAQNMANTHLIKDCFEIPNAVREDLVRIRLRENSESKNTRKSAFGGGRGYWASGLRAQGVLETHDRRLRFDDAIP